MYEREEVIIEWKDKPFRSNANDHAADIGSWQAFTESVPNIEVRIGAILSLERIAQDSTRHDKGRDHVRVMEILCAYIRDNSQMTGPENFESEVGDQTPVNRPEKHITLEFREVFSDNPVQPRVDLQLALSVIGRRNGDQIRLEPKDFLIDLIRSNLQGADMASKTKDGLDAIFSGARLSGARLRTH